MNRNEIIELIACNLLDQKLDDNSPVPYVLHIEYAKHVDKLTAKYRELVTLFPQLTNTLKNQATVAVYELSAELYEKTLQWEKESALNHNASGNCFPITQKQ